MIASPPESRRSFKVVIICALPLEAEHVLSIFDACWEDQDIQYGKAEGDQNAYSTGLIGKHNVVLAHMPNMGTTSASAIAAGVRSSFPGIQLALVAGICGVAPHHPGTQEEIILGDIIISTAVIQYDFGRQYPNHFQRKREIEDSLGRANPEIRSFVSMLETRQVRNRFSKNLASLLHSEDFQKENPTVRYPGAVRDRLFEASYIHQHRGDTSCDKCNNNDGFEICPMNCDELQCEESKLIHRNRHSSMESNGQDSGPAHIPSVHLGRFGSANSVMKSGVDRDRVAKADQIIAFEMEGAGVWDQHPTVVIKAACDYADSHKNKEWQTYAAATAAAGVKAFLKEWTVTDQPVDVKLLSGVALQSQPSQGESPGDQRPKRPPELTADDKECIRGFSSDYQTVHQKINVRHEGTCEWILRHPDFKNWEEQGTAGGPLWISGNAGMGKSVLAKFLIHSIENGFDEPQKVVYYFCDAQNESHRTSESLLKAIIHQYIRYFPHVLQKHIKPSYEAHGKTLYGSFAILWNIFLSISSDPKIGEIYCVLDGLDECEEKSRDELLKQIGLAFSSKQEGQKTGTATHGVRVIITSRPYESIRVRLFPFAIIRLRAENEEAYINGDIALYVDDELPKLAALRHYDPDLQECVRSALVEGGDGMFLWVSLMMTMLERTPTTEVRKRIKTMPRDIESVYDRVLEEIPDESREVTMNLLMWVAYARRPLFLQELGVASTFDYHSNPHIQTTTTINYSRDNILGDIQLCGPILKVQPDDSVHLVHQTTKEYLMQLSSSTRVPRPFIEENDADWKIAQACLNYLTFKPNADLENFLIHLNPCFAWTTYGVADPWDRLQKDLPFLRYACTFWHDHIRHLPSHNNDVWATLQSAISVESFMRRYPIIPIQFDGQSIRRPWKGYSPLHILIHSYLENQALRYIDTKKFAVNAQTKNGVSVLHLAAERGYETIVTKLLSRGADVELRQKIKCDSHSNFARVRSYPEASRNSTALHLAVRNGHIEVVRLLLSHGASANATEKDEEFHEINSTGGIVAVVKRSALHIAVDLNHLRIAQLLLDSGADTEAIEEHYARQARLYGSPCAKLERWTALHAATENGYKEMVAMLLSKGAKNNTDDAKSDGYYEILVNGSSFSRRHFGMLPRWNKLQDAEGDNSEFEDSTEGTDDIEVIDFVEFVEDSETGDDSEAGDADDVREHDSADKKRYGKSGKLRKETKCVSM